VERAREGKPADVKIKPSELGPDFLDLRWPPAPEAPPGGPSTNPSAIHAYAVRTDRDSQRAHPRAGADLPPLIEGGRSKPKENKKRTAADAGGLRPQRRRVHVVDQDAGGLPPQRAGVTFWVREDPRASAQSLLHLPLSRNDVHECGRLDPRALLAREAELKGPELFTRGPSNSRGPLPPPQTAPPSGRGPGGRGQGGGRRS